MVSVWRHFLNGATAAADTARDLANVDTLKVGITGLSGAGKTVFLVSLISNLLAMVRSQNAVDSLPAFRKPLTDESGQLRLLDVTIESAGPSRIPRFAFEAYRATLAQPERPDWPVGTDKPAQIVLRLTLQARSTLGRWKDTFLGPRVVRLELFDYPGEWLLDLPLLEQSFEEWSTETLRLMNEAPRAALSQAFRAFLGALSPGAPADDRTAEHGFELYREALRRCRREAELRWLQPGRFLTPGPWGDVPLHHFFPWTGSPGALSGTLAGQLHQRFEAYKREIRENFFEPYFSAFDRQVVLVDVLGALFAGRSAFDDTSRALGRIGASYARHLSGGWLFGRKIQHAAFVATKADYVDDLQRPHLQGMLERMVEAAPGAHGSAVGRSFHFVSSIRCTSDANAPGKDGVVTRVVMGTKLGEEHQRAFYPGIVPAGDVPSVFWTKPYFVLPKLRPPVLQPGDAHPVDHINLDSLLVDLIGDAL
ncbi:MAG: YcjX family protein [Reyranella sp.]|uniref:YcjX family protein n=1 Tax=Reyranella sp. TaxID=1929291 RepID=UPI003D100293